MHRTLILQGHNVTLKLKTADFEVRSRGLTLARAVSKSEEIFQVIGTLLQQEIEASGQALLKLRLLGNSLWK